MTQFDTRLLAPIVALILPAVCLAHGGEDHGPPVATSTATGRTAYLVSSDFELVLKWAPQAAGADLHVSVLLADRVTNRPIEGAAIELELVGPGGPLKAKVEPEPMPGHYLAHVTPPKDAAYGIVATVTAGARSDVLTADGIVLGPEPDAPHAHDRDAGIPWLWIGLGGGVVVLLFTVVALFGRLKRRRMPVPVVALIALWPAMSWSHGGEDHGPPAKAATAPEGFVAKEVQFLLGVETAAVEKKPLRPTLDVLGTVLARPDRRAEVSPPQAGLLLAPPSGRMPLIGEAVTRGQVLAIVEEIPAASDRVALATSRIEAKGRLAQASARASAARKKLARMRSVAATVSEREVQDVATEVRLADTERAEAARSLELFDKGIPEKRRFELLAPLDGVLFKAAATSGSQANPAEPLFEVVDLATVWVEARVFADDVGRLEGADEAELALAGIVDVVNAHRVTLAGGVDPTTRTLSVLFEAPNPKGLLRPGMLAEVRVGLGPRTPRATLRESAVVERDGVPGVYVKVDPEHFRFTPARLGIRSRDDREVEAGVKVGDLVVVKAAGTLD